MAIKLREIVNKPDLLSGGHRACAGCTAPTMIRQALMVAGPDTVVGFATGCMEVVTTIYPYTAWQVPYIHNAFENSAATISGAEAAYRALKRRGKSIRKSTSLRSPEMAGPMISDFSRCPAPSSEDTTCCLYATTTKRI